MTSCLQRQRTVAGRPGVRSVLWVGVWRTPTSACAPWKSGGQKKRRGGGVPGASSPCGWSGGGQLAGLRAAAAW